MIKGHPVGLRVLFFTEMWERFSYYGMRAALILFMTASLTDASGGLGFSKPVAAAIYGLVTAGVYLLALPGGWIADRILGQRKSVFWGGVLIAAGNFSLAAPSLTFFYLGLVLIVLGTGLLKPNVSTIVGELYPEGGAKRDAGFSIFYMGINIGALVGPAICGFIGETINWRLGFLGAGVGMVAGLIQYQIGLKHMGDAGKLKDVKTDEQAKARSQLYSGIGGVFLIAVLLILLNHFGILNITLQGFAQATGVIILLASLLFFLYIYFLGKLDSVEKKHVIALVFLFLASAIFWSGFEQAGSSMNIFTKELTNRDLLGWEMPATWFQSINPIFIVLLAPIFGSLWIWLSARSKEPSIPLKFAYGLLLLGAGFLVIALGASYIKQGGPGASPMWLVVTYFLHTCGELCLSPVGLSSVTKLAPKRFVGQMMGLWFMSVSLGNLIAGLVAGYSETLPMESLFKFVFIITAGTGVIFLLASPLLRKLTRDVENNV